MKGKRPWLALALVVAAVVSALVASRSSSPAVPVAAMPTIGLDAWTAPVLDGSRFGRPLRLIPASAEPCRPGDLAGREVAPDPRDSQAAASIAVSSRRLCRIGGPRTITFLGADRRPASPAVVVEGGDSDSIVVGPGHAGLLAVEFLFDPVCLPPDVGRGPPTKSARFDLAGVTATVGLTRTIGACPMRAILRSDDVYDAKTLSTALVAGAPDSVAAGGSFTPALALTYLGTTTAVFDPCPTLWAVVRPQSDPPTTSVWDLDCRSMRPLRPGDAVRVPVTVAVPGDLAPQAVGVEIGFGPVPFDADDAQGRAVQEFRVDVSHAGVPPLQPVPFVDREPPPITSPLPRRTASSCGSHDLQPFDLEAPGRVAAGTHGVGFQLRNVSGRRCLLRVETPVRLSRPGAPTFTPPRGAVVVFPSLVTGELDPDATTYVGFGSGSGCSPTDPNAGTHFDTVLIELPDGSIEVPFPIDERCGVGTTGVGVPGAEPSSAAALSEPYVTIHAPPSLPRGRPTTVQVVLVSLGGYELGCPGYAVTIAGIETRRGLNCAVRYLLPGLPTVYEISVEPPATAPPGPAILQWELLTGQVTTGAAAVTLT